MAFCQGPGNIERAARDIDDSGIGKQAFPQRQGCHRSGVFEAPQGIHRAKALAYMGQVGLDDAADDVGINLFLCRIGRAVPARIRFLEKLVIDLNEDAAFVIALQVMANKKTKPFQHAGQQACAAAVYTQNKHRG